MITFFAPAVMCALASFASVNLPVDSTTYSTPSSPQGSLAGSFSLTIFTVFPFITRAFSATSTVPGNLP